MNVYDDCPIYETESFRLRLVVPTDAEALLACYSDPKAVRLMNADRCTSDFFYQTVEEMQQCISFWLRDYEKKAYVRFAFVAKDAGRAVGTVGMFVRNIVTKAIGEAEERRAALKRFGFSDMADRSVPFDRPREDYFIRPSGQPGY